MSVIAASKDPDAVDFSRAEDRDTAVVSQQSQRTNPRRANARQSRPRRIISPFEPPSRDLLKFNAVLDSRTGPILDAACGYGRNAVALALKGLDVVCADCDHRRLSILMQLGPAYIRDHQIGDVGRLHPVRANLSDTWPFGSNCFSAIISVHFLELILLPFFLYSLNSEGYLYVETFGGQGGNYLRLPAEGHLRTALEPSFELLYYREKRVG